jgi:deoxyribodipyrimidine photo-lyase
MWFASIWIFTLKLPWELGADFFLKHLLDGDSASNTLSWRWVAGLHTQGKYYLAQPDNIRKYTDNRLTPGQLEHSIPNSSTDFKKYPPEIIEGCSDTPKSSQQVTLLIHEEDLTPELAPFSEYNVSNIVALSPHLIDDDLHRSQPVSHFRLNAVHDAVSRAEAHFKAPSKIIHNPIDLQLYLSETAESIAFMRPKVGYLADSLTPILAAKKLQERQVFQMVRSWDEELYPYATGGFFKFKKHLRRVVLKHCSPDI